MTKPESVTAAVSAALAKFGRVDVLVNNAGYGLAGAIEEATEDEFMPVFETNVFGLIRVTRAFLPQFRKQRAGNIVNLSSIAGLIGSPGWGYYNASKFAVNGFSEALAAEMAPLGVHVTIVEPGPFRTDFLGRSGAGSQQSHRRLRPDRRQDPRLLGRSGGQAGRRSGQGRPGDHRRGRGSRATASTLF